MIVDPAARANVAKTVAEADWIGLPVIWGEHRLLHLRQGF